MRSAKKKLDVISCLTRCESILGDVEEEEEEGRLRLRQRIEREERRLEMGNVSHKGKRGGLTKFQKRKLKYDFHTFFGKSGGTRLKQWGKARSGRDEIKISNPICQSHEIPKIERVLRVQQHISKEHRT